MKGPCMNVLSFFAWLNNDILALPTVILFLGAALYFSVISRFVQIRAFKRLFLLVTQGIKKTVKKDDQGEVATISGLHALCTAMATAIGTGSVVGPSLAIITGGPGALFWLVMYLVFGSVTKFTEIMFAIQTRQTTEHKKILGGPMQYLAYVSPYLASWYGVLLIILISGWNMAQASNLAAICALESVPEWVVGGFLAGMLILALSGGAQRVSSIASKLVPIMFTLYVSFALYIILHDLYAFKQALYLVLHDVFSWKAFSIATLLHAMHAGIYKAIFICEAGLGTSAIPHALADTKDPRDQAILGMYATIADIILSVISGLLVLVTGLWNVGNFRSTLIYEAFKMQAPGFGQWVLLFSILLFVLTTVIGNGFNGMQTFATFSQYRFLKLFSIIAACIVFVGAILPVPLVWEIMNTILAAAAIPHVIGLLILSYKKPDLLRY